VVIKKRSKAPVLVRLGGNCQKAVSEHGEQREIRGRPPRNDHRGGGGSKRSLAPLGNANCWATELQGSKGSGGLRDRNGRGWGEGPAAASEKNSGERDGSGDGQKKGQKASHRRTP